MSTKTSNVSDIKSKIEKLQALIDNPNTPETDKKNFEETIKKFQQKLEEEDDSKKKQIVKVKPKPKATVVEKKTPKAVTKVSNKTVVVDGKEMRTDSKEFCDYLTAQFIKRREKAKDKKGSGKKTKSVMALVSSKIEAGVEKAIKSGVSKQKQSLQKNPKVFIGKVEKLETATKNFLTQLKEVLGTDYDAKEVTDTANSIHKMIEDLKNKYTKK